MDRFSPSSDGDHESHIQLPGVGVNASSSDGWLHHHHPHTSHINHSRRQSYAQPHPYQQYQPQQQQQQPSHVSTPSFASMSMLSSIRARSSLLSSDDPNQPTTSTSTALTLTHASSYPSSSSNNAVITLPAGQIQSLTHAVRDLMVQNTARELRQERINEASSHLHTLNFALNVLNAQRSQQLQREYNDVRNAIEQGRNMIDSMEIIIQTQGNALTTLSASVDQTVARQEERMNELDSNLTAQRETVNAALAAYEDKLKHQEERMKQQEQVLARLLAVRFKLDFALDVLLALLAWVASHNAISGLVLTWMSRNVLFRAAERRVRNRRTRNTVILIQFALFLAVLKKIRQLATNNGLHHSIGSYPAYIQFALRTIGTALEMLRGGAGAGTVESSDDSEDTSLSSSSSSQGDANRSAALLSPTRSPPRPQQQDHSLTASPSTSSQPPRTAAVSPDYSESEATSVGQVLGSIMLTSVRASRDAVNFLLRHIVATGASKDMAEVGDDRHRQSSSSHQSVPSGQRTDNPRPLLPVSSSPLPRPSAPPATEIHSFAQSHADADGQTVLIEPADVVQPSDDSSRAH